MTTPDATAADPSAATATPRHVRRMIALMLTNLGLTALLTGLVLVFQDQLVDYQLAHLDLPADADLTAAREMLRRSVWSRVLPVALAALAYLMVIRGLLRGFRRAYRQVVFISMIVLVSSGLALLQPLPWWVRAVQAAKVVVVAALLFLASRRQVREQFAGTRRPDLVDGFPY